MMYLDLVLRGGEFFWFPQPPFPHNTHMRTLRLASTTQAAPTLCRLFMKKLQATKSTSNPSDVNYPVASRHPRGWKIHATTPIRYVPLSLVRFPMQHHPEAIFPLSISLTEQDLLLHRHTNTLEAHLSHIAPTYHVNNMLPNGRNLVLVFHNIPPLQSDRRRKQRPLSLLRL